MTRIMTITILGDGTIRSETDKVAAPVHQSAEAFLAGITTDTGGAARRAAKHGHGHHHTHDHAHTHTE